MAEAHPLFPAADDESEPPEVRRVHVQRTPDGTHYRAFAPEELTDYQQIYELFGGGQYTLLARNDRQITGRATVVLPGRSKPLNPSQEEERTPQPAPVLAQSAMAPSSDPNFVVAMMQMMQQNQASMMQVMLEQGKQQTQMMLAMMQQSSGGAREHIQVMQALHDRHTQEQAKLMQTVVEATRGASQGGGGMEGFMRGIEFAKEFTTGGDDDDALGEIFESMRPFLEGANAGKPPAEGQNNGGE
jgi:hypothetical protein